MIDVKAPSQHHHGNLKQALLDYALNAAKEGTLETFSLRKASRDLGVSPRAAYRHFSDRDAFMQTVAQLGFDILAEKFEVVVPFKSDPKNKNDAHNRFVSLAVAYVTCSQEHTNLWRLMFSPHGTSSNAREDRPSTYEWLGKSLQELARFGLIKNTDTSAQFFAWTTIHGLSNLANSPAASKKAITKLVELQCAFIVKALSG